MRTHRRQLTGVTSETDYDGGGYDDHDDGDIDNEVLLKFSSQKIFVIILLLRKTLCEHAHIPRNLRAKTRVSIGAN